MDEGRVTYWKALPPAERLSARYREAFKDAGYEFARSVINVARCPACPVGAKPDPEKLLLKAEIEGLLAGDEDALASTYAEHGL